MSEWTVSLGKVDYNGAGRRANEVEIRVELRRKASVAPHLTVDLEPVGEYVEFSMCGAVWNNRRTDHLSGGQNLEDVARLLPENAPLGRLVALWRRWHLNGMKAGTRMQNEYLAAHPFDHAYPKSHYEEACGVLKGAGLYEDRGYKYGSAWLVEPLPADVEREIKALVGAVAHTGPVPAVAGGDPGARP